ncbi:MULTISPECIES: ABC transporter permease [Bacillati]|uniref:ABC transporter permease n=4 Tax=Bacillati TaxID=1783272 RepID=A0A4Q5AHY8_9BIFI|nr:MULTISPECIES: ABC transporter permease [Terrabacteria group]MCH4850615.1 ABC transporter permease [Bifidobacterium pseudolongum]PKV02644.1 efflux ABC transporter, permease protein [Bifidobacterium pseudolongum subsp. globosum]RYQ19725.1 ABC transporter permease [Bifidobacterium pseudolongum subsp. globosum]RYQ28791.1 ABC transporter permease [Bifidobacterium pseudolongum subsp. globosum]RYQ54990.1 ABC transporter permease [Bifidobacterium pseudolongum subsp. globosum]
MFLAWNEIKHAKLRYSLVMGVMFLIAYLVFFLTGLAYGLAQDNRTAIDKWQADTILLSKEANSNLNMSMIARKELDNVDAKNKALLAQTPGVIVDNSSEDNEKIDVSFFGIEADSFLAPKIVEGKMFASNDEVVADSSVKEQYGIKIGDELSLSGNEKKLTVVGFTENAKFSVSPVLYTSINAFQEIRFEKEDTSENARINGIVIRGPLAAYPDDLEKISVGNFINDLPGYSAQVLTFGFMIGFLIVIAAIVIGIFVYVLTMQKQKIFGVMKAQGISSGYIAKSVIVQTFLLAFVGVVIGALTSILTSFLLPAAVPYQNNYLFLIGVSILMLLFAVSGALFSVRTIVKIDPLKAIG